MLYSCCCDDCCTYKTCLNSGCVNVCCTPQNSIFYIRTLYTETHDVIGGNVTRKQQKVTPYYRETQVHDVFYNEDYGICGQLNGVTDITCKYMDIMDDGINYHDCSGLSVEIKFIHEDTIAVTGVSSPQLRLTQPNYHDCDDGYVIESEFMPSDVVYIGYDFNYQNIRSTNCDCVRAFSNLPINYSEPCLSHVLTTNSGECVYNLIYIWNGFASQPLYALDDSSRCLGGCCQQHAAKWISPTIYPGLAYNCVSPTGILNTAYLYQVLQPFSVPDISLESFKYTLNCDESCINSIVTGFDTVNFGLATTIVTGVKDCVTNTGIFTKDIVLATGISFVLNFIPDNIKVSGAYLFQGFVNDTCCYDYAGNSLIGAITTDDCSHYCSSVIIHGPFCREYWFGTSPWFPGTVSSGTFCFNGFTHKDTINDYWLNDTRSRNGSISRNFFVGCSGYSSLFAQPEIINRYPCRNDTTKSNLEQDSYTVHVSKSGVIPSGYYYLTYVTGSYPLTKYSHDSGNIMINLIGFDDSSLIDHKIVQVDRHNLLHGVVPFGLIQFRNRNGSVIISGNVLGGSPPFVYSTGDMWSNYVRPIESLQPYYISYLPYGDVFWFQYDIATDFMELTQSQLLNKFNYGYNSPPCSVWPNCQERNKVETLYREFFDYDMVHPIHGPYAINDYEQEGVDKQKAIFGVKFTVTRN